jgi:hypothetical protein
MTPIVLALALLAQAKPDPKKPPAVDPVKVDQAIKKGVEYLRGMIGKYGSINTRRSEELILWTFVHAGVPETDAELRALFKTVTETPLEWTYNVSLQAMILEELDRVKYQARIAHCAQFLVDNQCRNGQWSYGSPTLFTPDVPTGAPRDVASGGARGKPSGGPAVERKKPKVVRRIPVKKMREGPPVGDNSNSQYASLGLRACHDAGIVLPAEVVQLAEKWWRESANEEQAGGYGVEGWTYGKKGSGESYGSMTAGAVGGLLICDYIQNRPWMKDKDVVAGLEWLARNFSVTENPKAPAGEAAGQGGWHYYFLYALERAGIFYGTDSLGGRDWYVEGAKHLLGAQRPDGAWLAPGRDHAIWDTCFAILFLRRATRPLIDVASVDRPRK